MRRFTKAGLVVLIAMLPIALSDSHIRASICGYFLDLVAFKTISGGVGIDHDDTSDTLIVSVNNPSGAAHNFNVVNPDTTATAVYSAASGMPGLIKLATIKSAATCLAGFVPGDAYAGNGMPGQIVKISDIGATVQNPWAVLPGEPAYVRGIYHDRHCSLGGDLIVVTGDEANLNIGNVWRVTADGTATLIVSLGTHLEGVVVLPNNTNLYGPMAGRILVGDEDRQPGPSANGPNGKLFAIDGTGGVFTIGNAADYPGYPNYPAQNNFYPLESASFNPHDIDIVPVPNASIPGDGNFVGIEAGSGQIYTASGDQLNSCECGDLLLTQEIPGELQGQPGLPASGLSVLSWSATEGFQVDPAFAADPFFMPTRWQDVTFRGGTDCRTCVGQIGDYVWKDLDGDGLQDPNEPGIAGVKVTLTQPSTPGYSQSVLTDADGRYLFSGLCAGTYAVTVTLPSGDTFTLTNVGSDPAIDSNVNGSTVTLTGDADSNLTIDFGLKGPGKIGNFVWNDVDADGVQDGGEAGIGGVTLHLKLGLNNGSGSDIATTVTDGTGFYQFTNLNPGDYTVVVDAPGGYTASPTLVGVPTTDSNPNPSNVTLTLASPVDLTVDFGFFTPPEFGHIIVRKVTVPANTTTQFAFTTTGTGYNGFSLVGGGANNSGNLIAGTYSVGETVAAGWKLTSAVCDLGNTPAAINLAAGQTVTCVFTNTKLAALGDFVWIDSNSNGQQNGGEPGVPNVTVQLFSGITLVATTTTNASGYYLFPNLTPGTPYSVRFTLPSGYTFTTPDAGADATDSDANILTGQTGTVTLAPGETNLTIDAGLIAPPPPPVCVPTVINLTGSTSTSGAAGNIRTFTSGAVSVKASAWSRTETTGAWSTAYLGAYGNGLGVTDGGEGTGGGDTHTVDNMGGRDNYILFEFNTPVLVDQAFLDYVGADSDISVWVGNKVDPFNNHLTLSDVLLGSLANEENETTSADARWANFNGASVVGNVLVIAAMATDTTQEDSFKLAKLDVDCTPPPPPVCVPATFTFSGSSSTSGTAGNIRTFAVSGTNVHVSAWSRTKSGSTWNTAYLGLYSPGLGVTDGSEGTGSGGSHKVDNNGTRENYVLFEFSQPVIVDKAFLTYIAGDSDLRAWVGTKTDPYNNHQVLDDAFLSSLLSETNLGTAAADTRWAEINSGSLLGNILVIATKPGETGDEFKINKLQIACVPPPPTPSCVATNFTFSGGSSTSGSAGNIRTFTSGGTSVKASAFSRTDGGSWNSAFLGAYSIGLGVTDGSEGSGGSNSHTVDNSGRDNYVLFEFSAPVKIDRAFLNYIGEDSDISVWIGSKVNPYTNHLSLSDALLATLTTEVNTSSATDTRWADINGGGIVGNVLVIATKVGDTNDSFKLNKLDTCK